MPQEPVTFPNYSQLPTRPLDSRSNVGALDSRSSVGALDSRSRGPSEVDQMNSLNS